MPIDDTYNWNELFPGTSPSARRGHAMIWDGTRIIMFGGANISTVFDETWEFDGTDWNQLSPVTTPPARLFHTMAWDGSRIVMWGGRNASTALTDTWEFDGSDWTDLSPATTPGNEVLARTGAMVWDDANSRFILNKWHTPRPPQQPNDTYEFVGGDWNLLSLSPEGPYNNFNRQIQDHAVVAHGNRIFSTGGRISTDATTTQTDEFDGSGWVWSDPATLPGTHRSAAQLAYDGSRSLLFAGNLATVGTLGEAPTNDNWLWDGTNWDFFNPSVKPDARYYHAMIWDTIGERMLMFGGYYITTGAPTFFDDTWELATMEVPAVTGNTISHIFGLGD